MQYISKMKHFQRIMIASNCLTASFILIAASGCSSERQPLEIQNRQPFEIQNLKCEGKGYKFTFDLIMSNRDSTPINVLIPKSELFGTDTFGSSHTLRGVPSTVYTAFAKGANCGPVYSATSVGLERWVLSSSDISQIQINESDTFQNIALSSPFVFCKDSSYTFDISYKFISSAPGQVEESFIASQLDSFNITKSNDHIKKANKLLHKYDRMYSNSITEVEEARGFLNSFYFLRLLEGKNNSFSISKTVVCKENINQMEMPRP